MYAFADVFTFLGAIALLVLAIRGAADSPVVTFLLGLCLFILLAVYFFTAERVKVRAEKKADREEGQP